MFVFLSKKSSLDSIVEYMDLNFLIGEPIVTLNLRSSIGLSKLLNYDHVNVDHFVEEDYNTVYAVSRDWKLFGKVSLNFLYGEAIERYSELYYDSSICDHYVVKYFINNVNKRAVLIDRKN